MDRQRGAGRQSSGRVTSCCAPSAVPADTAAEDCPQSNDFRAEADRKVREGMQKPGYMENPDLLIPPSPSISCCLTGSLEAMASITVRRSSAQSVATSASD